MVFVPDAITPVTVAIPLSSALFGSFAGAYLQRRFERKSEIRREIYRPLYNEISPASHGGLPFNFKNKQYQSIWTEISEFQRVQIDDELVTLFEEYSKSIDKYEGFQPEYLQPESGEMRFFEMLFENSPDDVISTEMRSGGYDVYYQSDKGGNVIQKWFMIYGAPAYAAENTEELREFVINTSKQNPNIFEGIWGYWDDNFQNWEGTVYDSCRETIQNLSPDLKEQLESYRNAVDVADRLEYRVKSKSKGVI